MTDNEKRAHDIAVACIPMMFNAKTSEAAYNNSSEVAFDIYAEYKKMYDAALRAINKDFSS